MRKLVLVLIALGLTTQFFAQDINDGMLPEVEIRAVNYKYLSSVDNTDAPVPVRLLQQEAARFDVTSADFYEDGSDFYRVYFHIPDGRMVAAYDRNGKIIYTIEKFKNVALPNDVSDAIDEKFPGWKIKKDVYRVSYTDDRGAKKQYKVVLDNGVETVRVKLDEKGVFL